MSQPPITIPVHALPKSTLRSVAEITEEITRRQRHVAVYAEYRDVCIERHDRHGVMDAEADMRELEASIRALQWALGGALARS